jgi:patatin-like phospholipase/acyl hydrolase
MDSIRTAHGSSSENIKRILILPGGGMKGLSQAVILAELERRAGKPLAQCVDLVAGTSIGGINACLLAIECSMANAINFFIKSGPQIFAKHWWRMFPIFGPKYNAKILEHVLKIRLGGYRLSDCHTNLLVPAYDLVSSQPHFFKSYERDDTHGDCWLWEVGRATSAAETYFGAYRLKDLILWDGGNVANNPAVCALADAVKLWGPDQNFDF